MRRKELAMSSRRLGTMAASALALAALVPAVALGGAGTASSHSVVLKEVRFHPGTLTIRRGDSVTWLWRDGGEEHNVTFHGFHSRTMGRGSYTIRFSHSGTFSYRCTIHEAEGMRGKIIVH
jgi:plastocyanin